MRPFLLLLCVLSGGCWSRAYNREWADRQVYGILENSSERISGVKKTFALERPVDTLRQRLLASAANQETITLSLLDALDVAAENSREFQRQKEQLYLTALNLTRQMNNFMLRFDIEGSADLVGVGDDQLTAQLRDELQGSANGTAGTRVVTNFVNTFLRSLLNGGSFDGSSILNMTLTQPLLRGSGRRIAREPLTQAERDVVYQTRDFERFRATFAVQVITEYYNLLRSTADLANVEANYRARVTSRIQTEELFVAGMKTILDLGRELQSEYSADVQRVNAQNSLLNALDRFKLTLGLPVTARIQIDTTELDRLTELGVTPLQLDEAPALELALQRRLDYRNTVDEVEDAGRRVIIAEDALNIRLDLSAAINVPAERGKGLNLDWSRIGWNTGFDLDLALDRYAERNAYRSALISFDQAIRAREQAEDQITQAIRVELRDIQNAYDRYRIQQQALLLSNKRVEATNDLYAAGRADALERINALDDQLNTQLQLNRAIVDSSIARLQLVRDLEAIMFEPKGLRFDPALPLPPLASAASKP